MSLVKQLWLLISFLIFTAFAASLAGSLLSAQGYYQEQLSIKNIDNANSLAITLSHTEKEPALLRSFLDAQFATGHYQKIQLTLPGNKSVELTGQVESSDSPAWFQSLLPLDIPAGHATVTDGWVNYGSLIVESDTIHAQNSLWTTAQRLFTWLLIVAVLAGLGGSWLVRRISQPLKGVVDQAEAIGDKRFVELKEPTTDEFRRVVKAMNTLSGRVKTMLERESQALADMRKKALNDAVTGVANREFFISRLDGLISESDEDTRHTLILTRISNLTHLNAEIGHQKVDEALRDFCLRLSDILSTSGLHFTDLFMGRLNGSDFGIILTDFDDTNELGKRLTTAVPGLFDRDGEAAPSWSASVFDTRVSRSEILMKADHLLAQAEQDQEHIAVDAGAEGPIPFQSAQQWREAISGAVSNENVQAVLHPLIRPDGKVIHREAKVRLKLNNEWRAAGFFLPWSRRLSLTPLVDAAMLKHLMATPELLGDTPVIVHLAPQSLGSEQARRHLLASFPASGQLPGELHFEVPESVLNLDDQSLRSFIEDIRRYGCRVGVSGVGQHLENLPKIRELGLRYIKTDSAYAQRLASDHSTRQYMQRLTGMAHGIGLPIYLAGANSPDIVLAAWELGFDGATGPGVDAVS
ncbi:EAL domain-containing protein [Marinobacter sp. F3R08]|uniref:bifunctional diguanylate cyclase/phosphodiesterase n=1 Tax=Marinobacter sp. F3R08 TaxID=2841559 RepID=UPI001C0805E3|nr:EAL domain-containing protein [Marinobacter sp. F3R08]MBU2953327.1 EAL domain-containing protein [Marinobacter sp. F3R08]